MALCIDLLSAFCSTNLEFSIAGTAGTALFTQSRWLQGFYWKYQVRGYKNRVLNTAKNLIGWNLFRRCNCKNAYRRFRGFKISYFISRKWRSNQHNDLKFSSILHLEKKSHRSFQEMSFNNFSCRKWSVTGSPQRRKSEILISVVLPSIC